MKRAKTALAVALIVVALAVVACSRPKVVYVDAHASYTSEQLQSLVDRTGVGSIADEPSGRAAELRHEALVELRSQGTAQSAAADLITKTFPSSTASVPVYVERATFRGLDSLIIVEAWKDSRGRLSARRLWVIDAETGEVRYSASAASR